MSTNGSVDIIRPTEPPALDTNTLMEAPATGHAASPLAGDAEGAGRTPSASSFGCIEIAIDLQVWPTFDNRLKQVLR